ncbi:hypothetical protein P3X16_000007 [Cronobacter dublinensis]|nr:hypothetical protein [Cronobacter dublinensis]
MKKIVLITVATLSLLGCKQQRTLQDKFDQENGWVKIYSTTDINLAQSKADAYCGNHAFYLKAEHDSNIGIVNENPNDNFLFNYIPYQCNAHYAAIAGNSEAKAIDEKEKSDALKSLEKAKRHQYEIHKAFAKKHGGDSYSVVNPDGSIEAYSFDGNGNECVGFSNKNGSDVHCK